MRILYITSSVAHKTNAVLDYDMAFGAYSSHDIFYFDVSRQPDFEIASFDAIILSYSFFGTITRLSHALQRKIRNFPGLKIAIFQDEYLYFLRHRRQIPFLKPDGILTVVPEKYWDAVFGEELKNVPKMQALTGYAPEHLKDRYASRIPLDRRRWHIGYRTRTYRPIFGSLCQEKIEIGLGMRRVCQQRQIPANIEVVEEKRIYGAAWPKFIGDCRVVLGTESGCNIFDFDGSIAKCIDAYTSSHPDAGFWDIHSHCMAEAEGRIRTNQISPRIFEAASLGTGHILYEGEYSGILQPWHHYIPLKKDFSNIEEVLSGVRDTAFLEKMIDNAYSDLVASGLWSFSSFIKKVDSFMDGLPARHEAATETFMAPALCTRRLPFHDPGSRALQRMSEFHARCLANKFAGKNILVYGAGAAFRAYLPLFARTHIMGIVLDGEFLDNPPANMPAPCISFEEAARLAARADGGIIFCRADFHSGMYQKMSDIMPADKQPESCVLY